MLYSFQILDCMIGNLLSIAMLAFSLPPCRDMFQSSLGKPSEMHAVSRALSGGPVYVSDRPYTQEKEILRKIAFPSGNS